jgi:hypothetical protein
MLPCSLPEFADCIIEEANGSSGTWSLATYTQMRERAAHMSLTDSTYFVGRVASAILCPDTPPLARYKLAQFCTVLRGMQNTPFASLFPAFQMQLTAMFPNFEASDRIGEPTVRLLASLFQPENHQLGVAKKGISSTNLQVLSCNSPIAAGRRRSLF